MSQQELLVRLIRTLDHLGIDYMITGSIASSLQGEPRSTHDIDVVVSVEKNDVDQFVAGALYVQLRSGGIAVVHDPG